MKARIVNEKKVNIINDLRNGGKMVLVRSLFDRHGICTGFLLHIGKVIRQNFHMNSTMVVTDLGFDSRDTFNAIEDYLRNADNVFCTDNTAIEFIGKVIDSSNELNRNDYEITLYN